METVVENTIHEIDFISDQINPPRRVPIGSLTGGPSSYRRGYLTVEDLVVSRPPLGRGSTPSICRLVDPRLVDPRLVDPASPSDSWPVDLPGGYGRPFTDRPRGTPVLYYNRGSHTTRARDRRFFPILHTKKSPFQTFFEHRTYSHEKNVDLSVVVL